MKLPQEIKAGLFVAGAIFLFGMAIWTLGREKEIFSSQETYRSSFSDVKGLSSGAPVRLGGITIGRVSEIGFSNDLTDSRVHIELLINEKYVDRVRKDSLATIETQGLLGDRFITISSGKDTQLPIGAEINSTEPGDIAKVLDKASTVADTAVEIANNVNSFFKNFDKESLSNIGDSMKQFGKLAKDIEKGDGLIHKLIYPKKDGTPDALDDLSTATKDVKSLMEEIRKGDGVLHALVYEPGGKDTIKSLGKASENLATTAAHISELAGQIKSGDGLMHSLIYKKSPAGLDDIAAKLNATAENLKKASQALSEGSGTIGALLVDSKLYDNLVEVTDGAKRSFILRRAIRSSLKKDKPKAKAEGQEESSSG